MTPFGALSLTLLVSLTNAFVHHKGPVYAARFVPSRRELRLNNAIEELGLIEETEDRMKKTIESTVTNLGSIRAGRAQPSMLDRVFVDYYDTPTPLQQLASVSLQGSSSIIVSPFDKSCLKDIEKAIIESDVGMMPNNDGEKIRLNVPTLTEERRKELAKSCKSLGEEGKVAVRNIRRDGVDSVKKLAKDKEMGVSEDQELDALDALQKLTDKYIKRVDEIVANKEKDIMKV
mmetsp:Transcript_76147/g.152979  ORF Transcript_76147/g.152979 Transcript_76147/m.152979 type:complete len:232 (-) Transcript_76147:259-954(-)|eukprot:CAMPEP_0171606502 /NCGR_PEP_ID=MMETSP0990-20121206/7801_1 /TAXON_ID=483369 /ORGANISM="non described non described, Strain CCMP2098" /LENGTH=231 /DNA_ID=CAMNT_0012169351 /DNA_START=16 /DNA_END=711 /DNA_ORIENTATION=-